MRSFLYVQSHFEQYSLNNNLLIYKQMPTATRLKDYKTWEKDGKQVKKGAKSVAILEPHNYIASDGTERTAYNPKTMFDITDVLKVEPEQKVSYDEKLLIRALVTDSPVKIETGQNGPVDKADGAYYDSINHRIVARTGMSASEIFTSVAKAMVHAEIAKCAEEKEYRPVDHEFQARCAAYVLAKKYSVPTENVNIESIPPRYAGFDAKAVKEELEEIHSSVKAISERMVATLERPKTQDKSRNDRDVR